MSVVGKTHESGHLPTRRNRPGLAPLWPLGIQMVVCAVVSSRLGVFGSIGGTPETGACFVRSTGAVQQVLCSRCRGRNRRSAPVAQWIEQRFPKPQVAGSSPAGGANVAERESSRLGPPGPMGSWSLTIKLGFLVVVGNRSLPAMPQGSDPLAGRTYRECLWPRLLASKQWGDHGR
jgi:hypothetical protein